MDRNLNQVFSNVCFIFCKKFQRPWKRIEFQEWRHWLDFVHSVATKSYAVKVALVFTHEIFYFIYGLGGRVLADESVHGIDIDKVKISQRAGVLNIDYEVVWVWNCGVSVLSWVVRYADDTTNSDSVNICQSEIFSVLNRETLLIFIMSHKWWQSCYFYRLGKVLASFIDQIFIAASSLGWTSNSVFHVGHGYFLFTDMDWNWEYRCFRHLTVIFEVNYKCHFVVLSLFLVFWLQEESIWTFFEVNERFSSFWYY